MEGGPAVFRTDSSCPYVLRIPLTPGLISPTRLSLSSAGFPKPFGYLSGSISRSKTPPAFLSAVWPLSLSLAATRKISFDFSSCSYLDVSVRNVPRVWLLIHQTLAFYDYAGFPHSDTHGYSAYLRLPVAFRSLSRPSSAPDAKAFTLCSF